MTERMIKLVFALHGNDLRPLLLGEQLRADLAVAGVQRLQVNLDDDDVAPAMRFGPGAPVTALVTLWTSGDPSAAIAVLAEIENDLHGWRVTERRPIEPPCVASGERADALANIAILRRPEHMTREDYLADWLERHTPIAIETQDTFGYIQNIVEEALTPGSPEISAIVEELFHTAGMTDMHAFYGSGGDDEELNRRLTKLMDSVRLFGADVGLDLVPTSRYLFEV
ncbi:MAG: hypothetical protein ABIR57_10400 [Aeromicrobium sp.]